VSLQKIQGTAQIWRKLAATIPNFHNFRTVLLFHEMKIKTKIDFVKIFHVFFFKSGKKKSAIRLGGKKWLIN